MTRSDNEALFESLSVVRKKCFATIVGNFRNAELASLARRMAAFREEGLRGERVKKQ